MKIEVIIFNCMDMHNETNMASCGIRAKMAGCKLVVGAKQMRKAVISGRARRVFLAENADPAITEPLAALCRQNGVDCVWFKSMKDLGSAAGIEVGAAAAAAVEN